jgi:RHS repeat-associated protein
MPYYAIPLRIIRTLDVQEQFAQRTYLEMNPNTDPRFHLFGNWQFEREALVASIWDRTYPELLVADGTGSSDLFYREYPDFDVNTMTMSSVEDRLRSYGVPGRTLAALGWQYFPYDYILRTRQGVFKVLTGSFEPERMTDPVYLQFWIVEPLTGMGRKFTSQYGYQQYRDADGLRETNVQTVLSDVIDGLGHVVTFRPVSAEPPFREYRLTDGTGRSLRLDLNHPVSYLDGDRPGGKVEVYFITRVTDETRPNRNVIYYKYDGDRIIEVSYPSHANGADRIVKYDYDDRGNLVRITDPVGDTFAIEYVEDALDSDQRLIPRLKVSRMLDCEGNSVTYHYDHPNTRVVVSINGPNQVAHNLLYTYVEDERDTGQRYLTSEKIDVTLGYSGNQTVLTQWGYTEDSRFLLNAVIDPLGNKSAAEYNVFNQIVAKVDATGHQRHFTYDLQATPSRAQPNRYDLINISETNIDIENNIFIVKNGQTFRNYDVITSPDPGDLVQSTHRIASQTDELGNTTTFDYDDQVNFFPLKPSKRTDPLGKLTTRNYNSLGSVLKETDAEDNSSTWDYNIQGQLIAYSDPNGFRHSWLYDPGTKWLTDNTDALGKAPGDTAHSIHYDRNDAGQITRRTDATKDVTDCAYFGNKRLRSVTRYEPAQRRTALTYEANGTLTSITDASGHVTRLFYDEPARLYETFRDAPGSPTSIFVRDAAGRVTSTVDRNGQTTTYVHDSLGRLTAVQEPSWPADNPINPGKSISLKYDYLSYLLSTTDSHFPVASQQAYDAAGNLIRSTDHFGWRLAFTYDSRNDLIHLYDEMRHIDLTFPRDDTRRITAVIDSAYLDPSLTFRYFWQDGALVDNLYRIEVDASGIKSRFQYDPNKKLTLAVHEAATKVLSTYGYVYRADGRIGQATGDHQALYDYDGLKQLVAETDMGVSDVYDAVGNRLWRATQAVSAGQANVYDDENHVVSSPSDGTTFKYDLNGNLVSRILPDSGIITYKVDGANRLMSIDDGTSLIQYLYSFDGRLVQRVVTSGKSKETERYRYGGGSILAVADVQNKTQIVYTRDDRGRLLRRRSTNTLNPLPTQDPHSLFYLHNGIGNVCQLIDRDGLVRLGIDYDAWGGSTENGSASPPQVFRFRQGYCDPVSALIKFGLRWYDSKLGRWVSEDPLALSLLTYNANLNSVIPDLVNLYAYAANDPLNVSDFTGLDGALDRLNKWAQRAVAGRVLKWIIDWYDKGGGGTRPEEGQPPPQVAKKQMEILAGDSDKGQSTNRSLWEITFLGSLLGVLALVSGVGGIAAGAAGAASLLTLTGSEAGASESGAGGLGGDSGGWAGDGGGSLGDGGGSGGDGGGSGGDGGGE